MLCDSASRDTSNTRRHILPPDQRLLRPDRPPPDPSWRISTGYIHRNSWHRILRLPLHPTRIRTKQKRGPPGLAGRLFVCWRSFGDRCCLFGADRRCAVDTMGLHCLGRPVDRGAEFELGVGVWHAVFILAFDLACFECLHRVFDWSGAFGVVMLIFGYCN